MTVRRSWVVALAAAGAAVSGVAVSADHHAAQAALPAVPPAAAPADATVAGQLEQRIQALNDQARTLQTAVDAARARAVGAATGPAAANPSPLAEQSWPSPGVAAPATADAPAAVVSAPAPPPAHTTTGASSAPGSGDSTESDTKHGEGGGDD